MNARRLRFAVVAAVAAAIGSTAIVAPDLAAAAPHATPHTAPHAQPSASDVEKKLGRLAVRNTHLVEKYDQARIATRKAQKAATAAEARAAAVAHTYARARAQYVQIVQGQYEGTTLGAAGALLQSSSDSDYLDRISSLGMMSTHVSNVVGGIAKIRAAARQAAAGAQQAYATAKSRRDALAKQRKTITAQIAKYRRLLAELNSQQQADYLRAQSPSPNASDYSPNTLPKAPSAAAERAVRFALAQVGDPYVFGAAGPDSWDCSGLTMMAWRAGGVSLPHSALGQFSYGTHVSLNDLSPGDLIFMYHPIGHVTIYIGNGLMVSAPTEGQDVTVVPVSAFSGDIVGATHLR